MTTLGGKERGAAFESFWLLFILFYFIYFRACVCVLWRRSPAQPRKSGYNFVALRLYRYDRDRMLTRGSRKGRESEKERGEKRTARRRVSKLIYQHQGSKWYSRQYHTHTGVSRKVFWNKKAWGYTARDLAILERTRTERKTKPYMAGWGNMPGHDQMGFHSDG